MDEASSILKKCKDQLNSAIEGGDKNGELSAQDDLGQVYASLGQYTEAIACHKKVASIAIELGLCIPEGRAYYKVAYENSSLGNYKEAIKYYQKCLRVLQGKGDEKIERMAYCNLGSAYFVSGNTQQDYKESIKYLEKSLAMALDAADSYVEVKACHNLGNSYMALEKFQEAISYYEKSLRISNEMGDKAGMTFRLLGDAYQALKRYQEAITYHKRSLEYAIHNTDKEAEKTAYLNLGTDSHGLRDYENAVEYFQQYLNTAKILGDKKGKVQAYRFIGNAYFDLKINEEALQCHQNSLSAAIEIGDKYGVECAYSNMGLAHHRLEQYQEALECYEKMLNIAVEKGDRKEEGKTCRDLANVHVALRNYEDAIKYHKTNLDIVKEIGDRDEEGTAYANIGEAYSLSSNYKEAIEYYEKALIVAVEMGDRDRQQGAYSSLGILYGKLNRHEESIECLEKKLQMVIQKGDALAEASVYSNLGNVYVATGRYEEAFNRYHKCLAIALEKNDKSLQETVYCNLGNAYFVLGNKLEADKHYVKSADIAINSRNKEAKARGYCILGRVSGNSGDYNNSIEYAKKHLNIAQMLGNKHRQAFAYHDLGRNSFLLGKYQDAIKYLEKSLNMAKEIGDKKAEGEAYEYLGYVYEDYFKNYPKAIDYFTRHFNLAKEIGDKSGAGKACRNLGTAFLFLFLDGKVKEHKDKAEYFLKDSLQWYDSLFEDLGEQDQHKINVVDTFIYTHKLLVELYIETEQPERALLVSEQERGRALEDILKRKYKLERKVDSLNDFLGYADIENKVLTPDSCILFFSDLMKMKRSNFELQVGTWVLDLESHVSFYRNELKEIKALLEERVLDKDIRESKDVLYNLVDKTYTTMSVRGAAACENRSFNIHEDGAVKVVASNSQDPERSKRCIYDEELDQDYLEVLFDALIAPVQDKLTHDEIVIIPDGPLFKIPFAALRDPNTKLCLAETKRIRIVPSLTTLMILKESSVESHSMTGALIVGDPDVNGKRIYKGEERLFNPLPNARIEAEKIGDVLGVTAITGTQATKQAIKQRLSEGVAVVHFAAHGCADSGQIVLSPPAALDGTKKIPEEEDYLLTINEVQEIGLRARLVVLSCCHSGRGEIKSEGVIGMSRAFLAAGALAVVASLWAVDDQGTRVFMEKFYAYLKQGKSASKSLQQAMKEMREMAQYEKPMFWAPFVLIGDDVTVKL